MTDKYAWFRVEGIIVGWLDTGDDENESIYEHDVAVVQTDDGRGYIRWLGNDWDQVDPPPKEGESMAAIGTRISFQTNISEQTEHLRIALGKDK